MTKFSVVYNCFFGKITDDLYVELTPEDTLRDLQILLLNALVQFEFPRANLYDYTITETTISQEELSDEDFIISENEDGTVKIDDSFFAEELTLEEINILSYCMLDGWLQRQITSIENTRMKYSGSDYKFTSQANHLSKLISAQDKNQQKNFHLQRLYKRRIPDKDNNGRYKPTWDIFRKSALE